MSLYDYQVSVQLASMDAPFYGLVMAAMRRADTDNAARLRALWPDTWVELQARHDAPGGHLPSDAASRERTVHEETSDDPAFD